jgi:hypothetical protein
MEGIPIHQNDVDIERALELPLIKKKANNKNIKLICPIIL